MKRRRTKNRRLVAAALLEAPDDQHWGYKIAQSTGVEAAQVAPILKAMHSDGWLTDSWEDPATVSGRGPRRYYMLTALGREQLQDLVS